MALQLQPLTKTLLGLTFLFLGLTCLIGKRTHSYRTETWTPEEQLAGFELQDGFVIELVASEEDGIVNPIDLTFDDAGRLWTQTAVMYPLDPFADVQFSEIRKLMEDPDIMQKNPEFERIRNFYEGSTKGEDKILIIEDPTAAKPSKPRVWADGLAIPQSILPYKNGAYVAQGSELFFLNDSDGDGLADERNRLLTGFGFIDTHTMAHLLIRAPGDWIYFSQGALNWSNVRSLVSGNTLQVDYSKIVRMSMDGRKLDLVSSGSNNIWGFQLRANGQWYGTEANDKTWSVVPMEPGTGFFGIGFDRLRPYQPWIPEMHDFRVGGTGISGLEFAEDSSNSFPSEWKDIALLANTITASINCVRIVRNPDGSVSAEHLPDLLKSKDDWFRPVNLEFGPDGCLYIADWYNKIISHNELPRSHPDRDKSHGRIWRIRHESQKPGKIPNLFEVPTKNLVSHLKGSSLWEKRAAWHQITDRGADELSGPLIKLAKDKRADVTTRIHALWSLEGIKHFSSSLMGTLLKSPDDELRREAIRSLASFDIQPSRMARYLKSFIDDPNVMVRSQVLRTLADYGQANREIIDILVTYCRPDIQGEDLGGPYERTFERYLARMALEKYQAELQEYLNHSDSKKQPPEHRFWAIQARPLEIREPYFLALWDSINSKPWDQATFIEITHALKNKSIYAVAKPAFENLWNASHLVSIANEVVDQVASDDLKELLKPAVAYLLSSQDQTDQEIGLKAVESYRVPGLESEMIRLLESPYSKNVVLSSAISALERSPSKLARDAFLKLFENPEVSFEIRLSALGAYLKAGGRANTKQLHTFIASFNGYQKDEFTKALSSSKPGAQSLLSLLNQGQFTEDDLDNWTLERMLGTKLKSDRLSTLLEQRKNNRKAVYEETFKTFMEIAESGDGDPELGKPLFTATCLTCHSVGSDGVGWAPALDGSAYRDNEGLLTAILDPNAAMEGAYGLRRILKTDGTMVEGYMEKQNEHGVTFRFMGGSSLFVPQSEIKTVQTIRGRSSMPEGLIDQLPHEQVANFLAYVRTLK